MTLQLKKLQRKKTEKIQGFNGIRDLRIIGACWSPDFFSLLKKLQFHCEDHIYLSTVQMWLHANLSYNKLCLISEII